MILDSTRKTVLHLNLIQGIGPATIERLIQSLGDFSIDSIHSFSISDFANICKLSENLSQIIYSGLRDVKILDQELSLIEKHKIKIISVYDQNYPILLKNTYLPPAILYIRGADLETEGLNIALVGSRKANNYGYRVVNMLVPDFVSRDFTIVSGGALGIDSMAHQSALNNSGKTVAVIGSGLLKPYPATNLKLFDEIVQKNGSVISPFPLTFAAAPGNFPARNRIISGLSQVCIVVQAAIKSGALITGHYAMEQGREVFAVPGHIDDELSGGCHKLISEGAHIFTATQDVYNLFDTRGLASDFVKKSDNFAFIEKNISQNINTINTGQKEIKFSPELSLEEKIVKYCSSGVTFDELFSNFSMEMGKFQELLISMQINGLIDQDFSGLWKRS